jgi:hypothetical protein
MFSLAFRKATDFVLCIVNRIYESEPFLKLVVEAENDYSTAPVRVLTD